MRGVRFGRGPDVLLPMSRAEHDNAVMTMVTDGADLIKRAVAAASERRRRARRPA